MSPPMTREAVARAIAEAALLKVGVALEAEDIYCLADAALDAHRSKQAAEPVSSPVQHRNAPGPDEHTERSFYLFEVAWDEEAGTWLAMSHNAPFGLVTEAPTKAELWANIGQLVPELEQPFVVPTHPNPSPVGAADGLGVKSATTAGNPRNDADLVAPTVAFRPSPVGADT